MLLLRLFTHDLDAQTITNLVHLNRNTVNRYIILFRNRIADRCQQESPIGPEDVFLFPEEEAQTSKNLFIANSDKDHMFGLIQEKMRVFVHPVPNSIQHILKGLFRRRVAPQVIKLANRYCKCHSIVNVPQKKLFRLIDPKSKGNFRKQIDISGDFWSYSRKRLSKFNGIAGSTLYLHMKESEFRFNRRNENLYELMLQEFRHNPL